MQFASRNEGARFSLKLAAISGRQAQRHRRKVSQSLPCIPKGCQRRLPDDGRHPATRPLISFFLQPPASSLLPVQRHQLRRAVLIAHDVHAAVLLRHAVAPGERHVDQPAEIDAVAPRYGDDDHRLGWMRGSSCSIAGRTRSSTCRRSRRRHTRTWRGLPETAAALPGRRVDSSEPLTSESPTSHCRSASIVTTLSPRGRAIASADCTARRSGLLNTASTRSSLALGRALGLPAAFPSDNSKSDPLP